MAENIIIKSEEVDLTGLVGRQVVLKTEQFPGKGLSTRILGVRDKCLVIDRSGSSGMVDQLIHNQKIEVRFSLKGQPAKFVSTLTCPKDGRMQIPISAEIFPETRRKFRRVDLISDVQLTVFDEHHIGAARLNRLKWLETKTINISGGGMLVTLPLNIISDHYLICHLRLDNFELPKLLVGRTRHAYMTGGRKNRVGVEFIVREDRADKLPKSIIKNLPVKLFDFNREIRCKLAEFLVNTQDGM
ncbi:MAG: PilZ domain-containing protein [Candidatus Zixiibacteriota bacterium]|nr:MAG: PilZ domain-containing protein [candidate division Zixibacteria bacterium]